MDGSTKILTVSYGTFSCTLEGFDDPLVAMRDIAEYFRDLAADDRYFGAEPPTPDVDMLQSIAEREVNRRVEARASETGVALRQVAQETKTVDAAPSAEAVAENDAPDEDAGALAARVVSAAKAADVVVNADEGTPDIGSGPLTFDDDFLMADEPEDVLAIDPAASVNADGPAESVAEKLRRIRAVVSRNIDAQSEEAELVDEGDVEEADAKRDRALTETIEQITADISDEDDTLEDTSDDEGDVEGDDLDLSGAKDAREEAFDEDQDAASTRVESAARDTSEALWAPDGDADDAASDQDVLEDEPELLGAALDDEDDGEDDGASLFDESDDDEDDEGDEDEDSVKRRISDIIGNVAERIEDDDEAEDELEEAIASTETAKDDEADDAKQSLAQPLSDDQDGDVGRILAETDTKLNEDDVVRRRRVISQMRAAVAATKADRLVSRQVPREETEEEERSPYRNDLSEVVRTATAAPEGNDRPKTSSPPLVLVSSQRVDSGDGEQDEANSDDDMPEDFADFAETVGAKELSELLEAAAAYTVFGEGNPSFTRPEIMKRVAAVDPTIRMSREESLRSFGQLLRQGKFRKLERGQFTIDQDTKFNPKHRIAGE